MLGHAEHTAAYVVDGEEVAIIGTELSTATEPIPDGLRSLGIGPTEVASIALTHVHRTST